MVRCQCGRFMFSSPHRYCQNSSSARCGRRPCSVSSPHRYCQNLRTIPLRVPSMGLFQALIGTAKTDRGDVSCRSRSWFQALIGTAKTVTPADQGEELLPVSSPHRYCQNSFVKVLGASALEVSSPHRYCQNRTSGGPRCRGRWFQALIGTAKTPHRYCRNEEPSSFQALIGTAKTCPPSFRSTENRRFKPS